MPYFYGTFRLIVTILKGKMTIYWGQNNHFEGENDYL